LDALEAIRARTMRPKVGAIRPDRSDIEELLELAVRAPNHHLTEPWRFYVLAGAERERLADAISQAAIDNGVEAEAARADAIKKVERAPVIVVFTRVASSNEEAVESEDFASVAMAIENFLIGAHAKGLGAMLRTGPAAYHPAIRGRLGLADDEEVLGFVYLGYPEGTRAPTPRRAAHELTSWFGWE
jgi:nitroreductase